MWKKAFLTLLGVYIVCAAENNQSELMQSFRPIKTPDGRERQGDTPEVVLQLKYEEGELNKIYLTQFRKEAKSLTPPVPAQSSLCLDLCHGGFFFIICVFFCFVILCFYVNVNFGIEVSVVKHAVQHALTWCQLVYNQPWKKAAQRITSTDIPGLLFVLCYVATVWVHRSATAKTNQYFRPTGTLSVMSSVRSINMNYEDVQNVKKPIILSNSILGESLTRLRVGNPGVTCSAGRAMVGQLAIAIEPHFSRPEDQEDQKNQEDQAIRGREHI